jgi:succinate dehydrogenase / fumarate reductase cytochrome b subunit|tara:strand:+ start:4266 stop:4649 length:384 start_codon:yes stop_codon:yes gene_type:complete
VVDKKRPVNLDIGTMKLPITAYVSILHRVSGVATLFALAILLWLFDQSLASQQSFDATSNILSSPLAQFLIWGSLAAITYHTVAGIRHLIMDLGVGEESFNSGRISAWIAVAVAVALIAALTGWVIL